MAIIPNKEKISLYEITPELVISIISNKDEPFNYSSLKEYYLDNKYPKEKLGEFSKVILDLLEKKYIVHNIQKDGRIYSITNKWRLYKFMSYNGWGAIGVFMTIIGLIMASDTFTCKHKDSTNINSNEQQLEIENPKRLIYTTPTVFLKTQKNIPKNLYDSSYKFNPFKYGY